MADKKKAPARDEKRAAAEYYRLNTKAVEDLVTADETNSPEVSEEELRKYQSGPKLKLSQWLKIALIKAWFAGAVCFFFLWGLGTYITNIVDQIFVTGIALGFVNDLLVGNLLRFMEKTPGANARWMMFPKKGYITLPLNVLYAFLLMLCIVGTYEAVNGVLAMLAGTTDQVLLGVEPILFGTLATAWDALFLKIKHVLGQIVDDAKRQVRSGR